MIRHLTAAAALQAVPFLDEYFSDFEGNEAQKAVEEAEALALPALRATLTVLVSARLSNAISPAQLDAARRFLPEAMTVPCFAILRLALEAQYAKNPVLKLELILDAFDAFTFGYTEEIVKKRNQNTHVVQPDFFSEAERNFLQSEMESTPVPNFWGELRERTDYSWVWDFWEEWHSSFFSNIPMDWEFQRRVALIHDSIWQQGAGAVAEAIRDIERTLFGTTPLEENALRKHVEHLLKNPMLSEATALNGAEMIERAISDYLHEAPANCLPEDLKHLEALPRHFKAIARVIRSRTSKEEKEPQLADEISKLHARVAELEKEVAVAKSKELKGLISQEAAKSFGKTIGSPLFWSGAAMSVGYFFGVTPSDLTLENFRTYVTELLRSNAETVPPAQPSLPSSIDV
ncbi:MAG: hypothetical protein GJ677_02700 [Rhodobacteraceae bacterium]|nr:hypothetical protein [Paracoccaceae bacterium]